MLSKHNRALGEGAKLWPQVTATQALGTIRFTMPSRAGKAAREVEQQVWANQNAADNPDTRGNPLLQPERATGVELGLE